MDTKLALVEEEMLSGPINLYNKHYQERELYDVTKPVPYDKHEAYEKKRKEQSNLFPGDKILDTSL